MKTRTKIILGIIAVVVIGLIWGRGGKSDEITTEIPLETAIEVKDETPHLQIIEEEDILQAEEPIENDPLDNNEEDELGSVDKDLTGEQPGEQPGEQTGEQTEEQVEDQAEKGSPKIDDEEKTEVSSRLEVHYIDVGQGDAALIVCGNEAMLVDAGDEDKGTSIQLYLKKHNINSLKYVIATHPDADHIGGLDVIVYKFDCGQILLPNCANDTTSFERLLDAMKQKGYWPHVVDIGEKYTLGDAKIEILSPSSEFTFSDTNDSSIVFRLDHGNNSFLFMGDATIPPQQALIYDPDLDIDVDVVKVPHHGAATAYIKGFYDEASPEYAVISCGRGNSYGHPRQEVLDDLRNRNTKVFRTDEQGTIVAISDGETITFNVEPSESWAPGEETVSEIQWIDSNVPDTNAVSRETKSLPEEGITYVYNKNSGKFHFPSCPSVNKMKQKNRVDLNCSREELLKSYPDAKPCKNCNP